MSSLMGTITSAFVSHFDTSPIIVESPGRVNLIGDHTDYNDGYVLPATINKSIILAIAPNKTHKIRAYSTNLDQILEYDLLNPINIHEQWFNYITGIVIELEKVGSKIMGFDVVFGGDIPIGAGLSSSAALEGALLTGLNKIFDLNLDRKTMAHIGQLTEHNHIGVKCGIMDQFVNLYGEQNKALLLDCRSLEYKLIPFRRDDIKIVICNSKVSHNLASSEYNQRRRECDEGIQILKKNHPNIVNLRDVTSAMLTEQKGELPKKVFNRCRFVLEENKRVLDASKSLLKNDFSAFGKAMFKSHEGLSNLYEVSCAELDTLVDAAKIQKGVFGSRMMGGGFGGCTINLVQDEQVELFCENVDKIYHRKTGFRPDIYVTEISSGTKIHHQQSTFTH